MKLFQNGLQLVRDGQADVGRVLQQAQALVGQIESDHRAPQRTAGADHMQINDVRNTHHEQDEHLFADALEAHGRGQFLVQNGAHDPGHVIQPHEDHEGDHQAVDAAKKVPQPSADGRDGDLDLRPDQRLSEYEQRVDTLQQFYDEAQRKKKRNRLILWGLVLTLAIWGIFAAGAIVILSVLVLIPYSAHFAMNALSWLAKLCGMQNESVISFAGYASGVVSAVPLAVLSWIAKTAWKKIRGNIGGFLTVSSN